MPTFPKINYIKSFREIPRKVVNKQISAAGYTMVCPRGTVTKRAVTLVYEKVSTTDVATIDTFFDTYQGSAFDLNIPFKATVYEVIFDQDEIIWSYDNENFDKASTEINFLET